jgi:hypothetical protein
MTDSEVLEKIVDNCDGTPEPEPIPKPEMWCEAKESTFKHCLSKVKLKAELVDGLLRVKPVKLDDFLKVIDATALASSTIAKEIVKELHNDAVWIWFR